MEVNKKKVYALVVAINEYPVPSHRLSGCINDANEMKEFLLTRCQSAETEIVLKTLYDEQASRANIIDGFINHLGQATSEDVALFYYCGHGGQETCPKEFWYLEPDHINQSLVCHDSRDPSKKGVYDLADKELGYLIYAATQNNPHFVAIMDCCHSGSGTRSASSEAPIKTRQMELSNKTRSIDTFVGYENYVMEGENLKVPQGRHILLAASKNVQTAKETVCDGVQHGVFTYCLLDALKNTNEKISYAELLKNVGIRVNNKVTDQNPQLEAILDISTTDAFLGGVIPEKEKYFTVSYSKEKEIWTIDAGEVHGIPKVAGDLKTTLAVFDWNVDDKTFADINNAKTSAEVVKTTPSSATIQFDSTFQADTGQVYKAKMMMIGITPMKFFLETTPEWFTRMVENLTNQQTKDDKYKAIELTNNITLADYKVVANETKNRYEIYKVGDTRLLVAPRPGGATSRGGDQQDELFGDLLTIANWHKFKVLQNPDTTFKQGTVSIEFYDIDYDFDQEGYPSKFEHSETPEPHQGALRLEYRKGKYAWLAPTKGIKIRNNSEHTLYFGMLHFTHRFGVYVGSKDTPFDSTNQKAYFIEREAGKWEAEPVEYQSSRGTMYKAIKNELGDDGKVQYIMPEDYVHAQDKSQMLKPGQSKNFEIHQFDADSFQGSGFFSFEIEDVLSRAGITEISQILKVIYSTEPFETSIYRQKDLALPMDELGNTRGVLSFKRKPFVDWSTEEVELTIIRPQEAVEVKKDTSMSPIKGISVKTNADLKFQVQLTSDQIAEGSSKRVLTPSMLRDLKGEQIKFAEGYGQDPGLSVVELIGVDRQKAATAFAQDPLQITLDGLQKDEAMLPIGRDGDIFFPAGLVSQKDGKTVVNIDTLPEESPAGTRSLGGSLKMMFQKIKVDLLGGEGEFQFLQKVTVNEDGTINRIGDDEASRVKAIRDDLSKPNCQNILLFIHGIIGDTGEMPKSMVLGKYGDQTVLSQYDLVLTFDYENLNTPIQKTASQLKEMLLQVGLRAGHLKNLHIVSHSMGGLVSRYFIESPTLKGNEFVKHLVMLGTPNNGSPWAKVEDMVTMALTTVLSKVSLAAWAVSPLTYLINKFDKSLLTLDQLNPKHDFFQELNAFADPQIPYSIIAGNNTLVERLQDVSDSGIMKRMFNKVVKSKDVALDFLFKQPHDIAVSVESITHPAVFQKRADVHLSQVACDHMSYFVDPAGTAGLAKVLFERVLKKA